MTSSGQRDSVSLPPGQYDGPGNHMLPPESAWSHGDNSGIMLHNAIMPHLKTLIISESRHLHQNTGNCLVWNNQQSCDDDSSGNKAREIRNHRWISVSGVSFLSVISFLSFRLVTLSSNWGGVKQTLAERNSDPAESRGDIRDPGKYLVTREQKIKSPATEIWSREKCPRSERYVDKDDQLDNWIIFGQAETFLFFYISHLISGSLTDSRLPTLTVTPRYGSGFNLKMTSGQNSGHPEPRSGG